jgi:uncharacterized SAM-binding protein YcdF (DUF218 family)
MFFYLSKIFWLFLAPGNILLLLLLAGIVLWLAGKRRTGQLLTLFPAACFVAVAILPVHVWLLRPLEDRFAIPDLAGKQVSGLLVLGGGMSNTITRIRGIPQLTAGGTRMTIAASLAKRFPDARIVFSGGNATLSGRGGAEAPAAGTFFTSLGIAPDRLVLESQARNTYENIRFFRDLVKPKPGDVWVLVTSAAHMPRSIGIAQTLGVALVPYPADYVTTGAPGEFWRTGSGFSAGLYLTNNAMREWIGLIVYYLTGRTPRLLPSGRQQAHL